jgi:glycosyltransferase involved in cell wall biosynthesis
MVVSLSVILPTHNRPAGLVQAVDSLLAADHPPEQLIIVNDGHDPLAADIESRCGARGVELLVLRRDTPCLPASRNVGLDHARGEISLMLEDDATCPSDYLDRLRALWALDAKKQIAAIGSVIVEQRTFTRTGRIFGFLLRCSGHRCWKPRRCPARYLLLPAGLAGRLAPASFLHGAGTSLRTDIARAVRYREDWPGYAFGEDREFSFRLSQHHPCFLAPELTLDHEPAEVTPAALAEKGRTYVTHSLATARDAT